MKIYHFFLSRCPQDYERAEYFETVYLPATQACSRAGGFMIFESAGSGTMTYADMRTAVARGCSGI